MKSATFTDFERPPATLERRVDLRARHATLHREMVDQLERNLAVENHWLIFTLLGWEHFLTCCACYYLVEVAGIQKPHRWVYLVLLTVQMLASVTTFLAVRGRYRVEESPLRPLVTRMWAVFLILCCDVAVLNVTAGLPVFVFLPVLATLSSFAFLVLALMVSRRFFFCGVFMFLTGIAIAHFPTYGFLIYGFNWLVVLQTLGVIFLIRRKRFNHERHERHEKRN